MEPTGKVPGQASGEQRDIIPDKKGHKKKRKVQTLCKLSKNGYLDQNFDDYKRLVTNGVYICKKCGRVATSKESLCKPVPLQED